MALNEKLVPRAIYKGVLFFIGVYILFVILGTLSGGKGFEGLFLLQIILFVLSGYVTGRIAKKNGWLNGIVLGIPLPFVVAIGFGIVTQQASMVVSLIAGLGIFWLILSIIFCCLGGYLADVHNRFKMRSL